MATQWQSLTQIIEHWGRYGKYLSKWAGPGHWHDPDMLLIGNGCLTYTPPILDGDSGATESHAHLITLQPVTDLTEDYSYGNVSGWGSGREGLGAAQTTLNVTFTQAEVGMELNVGTFTLNTSIKKPIPNVAFSPNRKVELLPEFHKVKYIIKAF